MYSREPLLVELVGDPLAQILLDLGERPVARGLAIRHVEEVDRAGRSARARGTPCGGSRRSRRRAPRRAPPSRPCRARRPGPSSLPSESPSASVRERRPGLDLRADLLDPRGGRGRASASPGVEPQDDLGDLGLLGDRVELFLPPLVLDPQRVVGDVEPRGDVAPDDLLQRDRLAHLALQVVARHARVWRARRRTPRRWSGCTGP